MAAFRKILRPSTQKSMDLPPIAYEEKKKKKKRKESLTLNQQSIQFSLRIISSAFGKLHSGLQKQKSCVSLRLGNYLHVSAFRTFIAGKSSYNNTDLIYGACFVKYAQGSQYQELNLRLLTVKQNNMNQTCCQRRVLNHIAAFLMTVSFQMWYMQVAQWFLIL